MTIMYPLEDELSFGLEFYIGDCLLVYSNDLLFQRPYENQLLEILFQRIGQSLWVSNILLFSFHCSLAKTHSNWLLHDDTVIGFTNLVEDSITFINLQFRLILVKASQECK